MEGIGSKISHKIRDAIKAKLIELDAYVDDELPDYIMVMVANKRTRVQMDEDLQLFLGSNTRIFTSWLHTVLQKLQEVTVAGLDGKKESDAKKQSKRKRSSSNEAASDQKLNDDGKQSRKHGKKHKESKKAKKNKHKSKDKKSKASGKKTKDVSPNEKISKSSHKKDEVLPETVQNVLSSDKMEKTEKKAKDKKLFKEKNLQLNEAVGKAIIGNLKKSERQKLENEMANKISADGSEKEDETMKENGNVAPSSKKESTCADEDVLNIKLDEEPEDEDIVDCSKRKKPEVVEDEFNIEPLKPAEKVDSGELIKEKEGGSQSCASDCQIEATTIRAPTKELLKEHDKFLSQVEDVSKPKPLEKKKKQNSDSEESISPEEIRKQLLLSRAKKKLEERKLAERMKSNSPDILILETESKLAPKQKNFTTTSRSPPAKRQESLSSSHRSAAPSKTSSTAHSPVIHRPSKFSSRSYSSESRSRSSSPARRHVEIRQTKLTIVKSSNQNEARRVSVVQGGRAISPITFNREDDRKTGPAGASRNEKKKNVISISENFQKEKSLSSDLKKDLDNRKSREKILSARKKPVSSRVVTIPLPDVPEIPSIVKVKPREFLSKDKQANKALILKAVADAEKSIATAHTRNETDFDMKKPEALFTKNLRGKRYEKLAVTLSNVRRSPDSRDRLKRMVSVDSEHSDAMDHKAESFHGSENSQELRSRLDARKKISKKSDDHFISSKTTVMEKNDKYIHYWLEGVEKAVKDDEIVNPDDIEEFAHQEYPDEGNEDGAGESSKQDDKKRKKKRKSEEPLGGESLKLSKLSDKDIASLRLIPNCPSSDDGPEIVVTLDGLNSKTIKDIILKNRETPAGPLVTAANTKKLNEKNKDSKEIKYVGEKIDANIKITNRNNDSSNKASTSGIQEKISPEARKYSFEKISDRFGRINKTSENHEYKEKYHEFERERYEKKFQKYQGTEKERYYEKLKEKFAPSGESKNRKLIAQLSEKFGNIDREFENKKRKYSDDDRRYGVRRSEREDVDRDGKHKKLERKSFREAADYEDLRRMRTKERCMFWPGCSKGTSCEFHHPSSPCKLLPNCIYKDKCMYIHPMCKDDLHCHNRDCPYEHTSDRPRKNSSPKDKKTSSPPSKFTSSSSTQICKFYPNCKNLDCRYFHPKKCRYDDDCTNPDCKYTHSNQHQKKRPKWSSKS